MVKAVLLDDNQSNYVFKHVEVGRHIFQTYSQKHVLITEISKTNICFVV